MYLKDRNDDDIIADVFNENRYAKPQVDPLEEMAIALGGIQDKLAAMGKPMEIPMQMGPAPEQKPEMDSDKVSDLLNKLNDIVNQLRLYMPNAGPEGLKKGCGCGNPSCLGGH